MCVFTIILFRILPVEEEKTRREKSLCKENIGKTKSIQRIDCAGDFSKLALAGVIHQ